MRLFYPFLVLAGLVYGRPSQRSPHIVHETRAVEPVDWLKEGRLEANAVLPMRFGLSQQNLHRLEELLMEISHPDSPQYGQHWRPEKVVETFAPTDETISAVKEWLTDFGIAPNRIRVSPSRGWIEVNATANEVEDLLDTEYHVYRHKEASDVKQIGISYLVLFLFVVY